MLRKYIVICIVFILLIPYSSTNFDEAYVSNSHLLHSSYNKNSCNETYNSIINIGEVMGIRARFGFIDHQLNIHNMTVNWTAINGRINGTIIMNYSFYYLFDGHYRGIMATGFSVYWKEEKIGENKIFTMEKGEKTYMGKLPVNISLASNDKHIVLYAKVWFMCFPPNIFALYYHNMTSHGLLDWLTLGIMDKRTVSITIKIAEANEKLNNELMWTHTRHDLRNTGFTPAKGKGEILSYRMKIFSKRIHGWNILLLLEI